MKTHFLMLNHPAKRVIACPMVDDEGDILFFGSAEEALEAGKNSFLGEGCGGTVMDLCEGDSF